MKILAFDTATEVCSVALLIGNEMRCLHQHMPQRQADHLLPMIQQLISEAGILPQQLEAIAFGRGPGSFTGLRLAAGVAQGIAMGVGVPVIPVSTLAVLAQTAYRAEGVDSVFAVIDARMQEVYAGFFKLDENSLMRAVSDECVLPPAQIEAVSGRYAGAGNGYQIYAEIFESLLGINLIGATETLWPHAQDMLILAAQAYRGGEVLLPDAAIPVYLRDNVAQKKIVK